MNNSTITSSIVEIFSSIQGEGLLAGLRQIFIRFHGCELGCSYCDTPSSKLDEPPKFCHVEKNPGSGAIVPLYNPVSLATVSKLISEWVRLTPKAHHSISLTGGEPLQHGTTLIAWLPHLERILPTYLETNGILVNELKKCIEHLNFISMDFKLPSTTGLSNMWDTHRQFLTIAATKTVSVKAVISSRTPVEEIRKSAEIISEVDANIPFFLQPLTGNDGKVAIDPRTLLNLQEVAVSLLNNVRISPQMHKFMNVL